MDLAAIKTQIDKDFPLKFSMTPLHKDAIALVSNASRPVRMSHLAKSLCGEIPNAPGWTDKVLDLADALNDLKEAGVLDCSAVGWTKA